MAQHKEQNYGTHVRRDVAYHLALLPLVLLNIIASLVWLTVHPSWPSAWIVAVSAALAIIVIKLRAYPLIVQDRLIRLEERMRLMVILPEEKRFYVAQLSTKQLVALRFASDEELQELVEEALKRSLTPKQIKEKIKNWRPDHLRV